MNNVAVLNRILSNQRSPHARPEDIDPRADAIQDPAVMTEILSDVLKQFVLPEDEIADLRAKGARTMDRDAKWQVMSVLGHTNAQGWKNSCLVVVASNAPGVCTRIQPNGDWKLASYGFDIRRNRIGVQELVLGMEFIDANCAEDLVYDPRTTQPIDQMAGAGRMSPQITEALAKLAENQLEGGQTNALLSQLVALVAQQQGLDVGDLLSNGSSQVVQAVPASEAIDTPDKAPAKTSRRSPRRSNSKKSE